jgi:hypothetical protein
LDSVVEMPAERRNGQYNAWRFLSALVTCSSDAVMSDRIGGRLLEGGRQLPERPALIGRL